MPSINRFDIEERERIRARLKLLSLRTLPSENPRASVLVPLCHRDGRAAVLFTKRSETVGTHKGQVSFPGGRMDETDRDEVDCALRELHEELGVDRARVDVLGRFHEVMSITAMRVTPVIAYLDDVSHLRPEPAEIDEVFSLTLDELAGKRELLRLGPRRTPQFTAGPHPVWGLTALILDEVLREVLGMELPRLE